MCDQLSTSLFSYDIELMIQLPYSSSLKCLPYKGMNKLVAHVLHFKMAIAPVCVLEEKRDAIHIISPLHSHWSLQEGYKEEDMIIHGAKQNNSTLFWRD